MSFHSTRLCKNTRCTAMNPVAIAMAVVVGKGGTLDFSTSSEEKDGAKEEVDEAPTHCIVISGTSLCSPISQSILVLKYGNGLSPCSIRIEGLLDWVEITFGSA